MRFRRACALAAALIVVAPLPALVPLPALASGRPEAVSAAVAWIESKQAADGGFFGAGQPADQTAEAIAALSAANGGAGGGSVIAFALSYLRRAGPARADRAAYAGRIVMGLVAAGENPYAFGGVDYVARIRQSWNAATGAYETGVYADALAILGLVAARESVPDGAITYVRANQCSNGGFGHDTGCASRADTDTTAMVVCALAGAGVAADDVVRARARDWLRSSRAAGGGYPLYPGATVNANSTGLAVSALACDGRHDEESLRVLRSMQMGDGGVRFRAADRTADAYATVQALPALSGSGYPVRPLARAAGSGGAGSGGAGSGGAGVGDASGRGGSPNSRAVSSNTSDMFDETARTNSDVPRGTDAAPAGPAASGGKADEKAGGTAGAAPGKRGAPGLPIGLSIALLSVGAVGAAFAGVRASSLRRRPRR